MPGCLGTLIKVIVEVVIARLASELIKRLRGRQMWLGGFLALLAFLGIRMRQQIKP